MGFHEKSALACLTSICVVYIPYFAAIATRSIRTTGDVPREDELHEQIQAAAMKWSGFILAFAVLTWILVGVPVFTAMTAVHWLFAGFVFANVAYYGGIVIGYRRLAGA